MQITEGPVGPKVLNNISFWGTRVGTASVGILAGPRRLLLESY